MFLAELPAVPYGDPWNLPLHERIRMLARGQRRVAYFYEMANNSTFRYRTYNMVQVLNEGEFRDVSASYFFLEDLHRVDEIADLADVLVICRSRYCHQVSQLVTKFRVRDKRVLFDIDDFVFDASYTHLIVNTLDQDLDNPALWDFWFAYISRMGEALRLCDGAITTNTYLAAKIEAFSGLPVAVVPNFINKEQLEVSDALFQAKVASGFARNDKMTIAYFSGSPSHNLDFAIIESAIEEVMAEDARVELMTVGYIEAGPALGRFGGRVKRQPFHDYVNLQRLVGSVEFNLMPLQANVFTHCKSELKYFEAAIVGTQSIASPANTYAAAITNGRNGYIAQAHQWVSVMRRAMDNMASYPEMAQTAHAEVRSKYAWFNQRDCILQAVGLA